MSGVIENKRILWPCLFDDFVESAANRVNDVLNCVNLSNPDKKSDLWFSEHLDQY
jgi:hypothetical protein